MKECGIDAHGASDTGLQRGNNEDQFLIADLHKSLELRQSSVAFTKETRLCKGTHGLLLLVADGVGGHSGGERASAIAVDSATRYIVNTIPWFLRLEDQSHDLEEELKAAIEESERQIREESRKDPRYAEMGTTLTLAYVLWPRLYVVHVGDTRCYLYRNGELRRITRDHTMAQELVDRGAMSEREAAQTRWSSMLLRALGGRDENFAPDAYRADLSGEEVVMLCSDGLTAHVDDEEIREVLANATCAEAACSKLIQMANDCGGSDNITVVVACLPEAEQMSTGSWASPSEDGD